MLVLLADVVLWTLLGLYLDQVVPSQYGVAKPLCFCCQRRRRRANEVDDEQRAALLAQDDIGDKDRRNFEPVDAHLRRQEETNECLKVRGLVKAFGEFHAVKGTNLTMYNG